jgi:hypothetical protein
LVSAFSLPARWTIPTNSGSLATDGGVSIGVGVAGGGTAVVEASQSVAARVATSQDMAELRTGCPWVDRPG